MPILDWLYDQLTNDLIPHKNNDIKSVKMAQIF